MVRIHPRPPRCQMNIEDIIKEWEEEFMFERMREPSQDRDFVRKGIFQFLKMRQIDPNALLELIRSHMKNKI